MNELEELEQEGLDEQLLEVGGTADLPSVPATELPAAPGLFCKLNCRDFLRVYCFCVWLHLQVILFQGTLGKG